MGDDIEITESTDWKDTKLPALEQLDFSLRCQICKEFLTAPLLTSCGHSFCSLCIRRIMPHKSECPVCRTQQSEGSLRKNPALEDVVQAFVKARKLIMELATKRDEAAEEVKDDYIQMIDEQVQTEPLSDQDFKEVEVSASRKRKRTYTTRSGRTTRRVLPGTEIMDSDQDEEDDIYVLDSQQLGWTPSKHPSLPPAPPPPGMAQCPVCQKYMKPEEIQGRHIDQCLQNMDNPRPPQHHRKRDSHPPPNASTEPSTPKRNRTLGRTATGTTNAAPNFFTSPSKNRLNFGSIAFGNSASMDVPPERLPKLNYHTMKEKDLRKKMQELGLSTEGSKAVLQQRHAEYVMLVNANLDAKHPRSKRDLLTEMRSWESLRLDAERNRKPNHSHNASASDKEKEKEKLKEYSKENDDDFKRLIDDAKRRRQAKKIGDDKAKMEEVKKENTNSSSPFLAPTADPVPPPTSQNNSQPQFSMSQKSSSLSSELENPFEQTPTTAQHPYFSKDHRPLLSKATLTSSQPSPHMTPLASSQSFGSIPPISSQNTTKFISQASQHQQPQSLPQFQSYPHLTLDQQQIIYEAVSANPQLSSEQKQLFTHLLSTSPDMLQKVTEFQQRFNRPILLAPSTQPLQQQQQQQPQAQLFQHQSQQQQQGILPLQMQNYPPQAHFTSSRPLPQQHPQQSSYGNAQAQVPHPSSAPPQAPSSSTSSGENTGRRATNGV